MQNKQIQLLYIASDNNASSGAFLSMVRLCALLKQNYDVNPYIILPCNGDGTQLLVDNDLDYEIIRSEDWIIPIDCSLKFYLRKLKKSLKNIIAVFKIAQIIKKRKIDIVHINTIFSYVGAPAALLCQKPFVWHIKEIIPNSSVFKFLFSYIFSSNLINKADKIIEVSNAVKNSYTKLDKKKICVIHEGIDPTNFNTKSRKILENHVFKFICIGEIYKQKGQFDLIEALEKLYKSGITNWNLTFIGRGQTEKLKKLIADKKLTNNIKIEGYKNNIPDLLKNIDISFIPSHQEAFGRVVVESMLSGCLTIAANVGGIPEIIENQTSGLIHKKEDPNDILNQIKWVISNKDKSQQIAKVGQEFVLENFSADKNAKSISIIYTELIQKHKQDYSIKEQIFSLKNKGSFKVITILGVHIKINKPLTTEEKKELQTIKQYNVKTNSVLLVEINDWHGEVISGIAKYFLDLGFNIDILLSDSEYKSNPLVRFKSDRIKIFPVSNMVAKKLLENPAFIDKYTKIYLNSDHTFNPIKNKFTYYWEFLNLPQRKDKYIYMTHQPNLYNLSKESAKTVMLADLPINNPDIKVVNAHYFGDVEITNKNALTNFIVVGNIFKDQRNYNLLFNAIYNLIAQGIDNFKITSIARIGSLDFIPDKIKQYFDFKGCLSYPDMYDEIEKSDFFLPLLDPLNIDHNRYITTGTSGSFQLIYGFRKPCLIAEKFATIHGFNQQNSIVYKNNEDLTSAMQTAINMNQEQYHNLQTNLAEYADNLYQESLANLREIIKCSQS